MAFFNFKTISVLFFHGYSTLFICNCLVKRSHHQHNPDNSFYYTDQTKLNTTLASCKMELKCVKHKSSQKLTIPIKSITKPGLHPRHHLRVAFFVALTQNLGPFENSVDVVFDKVETNEGGIYKQKNGRVVAPVDGTYQFNVVLSAQAMQKAAVMLLKNNKMVMTVWAESIQFWSPSSNVAILKLKKDDEIWLMLLKTASYLHGNMYTTFSGFLIF